MFYGALAALDAVHRLSPPPVQGTWCIDSRFAWLRQHPEWQNAEIIAVGSSVTWRNLDFSVLPSDAKERGVVNAAPCFLTVNQVRYLSEFLLQRTSALKTVVTVLAPRDFERCSRNPTSFFDPDLIDQYILGKINGWWLRFRNFRALDVIQHAIYANERRPLLTYDKFGSGPLTSDKPYSGRSFAPEAECYAELTRLATLLESRGVQLIVVTFPVMEGWAEKFDKTGHVRRDFVAAIKAALAPTRAILVDAFTDWHAPDSAFTDPAHLQWQETAAFTRFVWAEASEQRAAMRNSSGRRG